MLKRLCSWIPNRWVCLSVALIASLAFVAGAGNNTVAHNEATQIATANPNLAPDLANAPNDPGNTVASTSIITRAADKNAVNTTPATNAPPNIHRIVNRTVVITAVNGTFLVPS